MKKNSKTQNPEDPKIVPVIEATAGVSTMEEPEDTEAKRREIQEAIQKAKEVSRIEIGIENPS